MVSLLRHRWVRHLMWTVTGYYWDTGGRVSCGTHRCRSCRRAGRGPGQPLVRERWHTQRRGLFATVALSIAVAGFWIAVILVVIL